MAIFLIPLICARCNRESERRSSFQKYCSDCGKAAKREAHRRANAKYEAARPPRMRDPEERRRAHERHRQNKPDAGRIRAARYNERHREMVNQKSRERLARPDVKAKRREIDRRYRAKPKQRVDQRMKAAIQQALKGGKAGRSWEALVGYSLDDLVRHLERQFLKGMSWKNIGEWEIDHIRPRSMFFYEAADEPAFRECWAITNLRPLWAPENRSKHARVTHLL